MPANTWTHDGHTYTFTRHRGMVTVTRDDGCLLWDTYPSVKAGGIPCTAAYQPALATIAEAKHLIQHGHTNHGTYVHRIVWATSAEDARRVREEMDNGN